MPESNLIEIEATDEFHGTEAHPSAFLKSLPPNEQKQHLTRYIEELDDEYRMASDEAERARVSILRSAARKVLAGLPD